MGRLIVTEMHALCHKKAHTLKHKVLFLNVQYSHIKKHISSYLWQYNKL